MKTNAIHKRPIFRAFHLHVGICLAWLGLGNLSQGAIVELPAESVQDKIRGGLLGHLLGDLSGLKHEMKYIAEPGNVTDYVPALPEGAWTDDDTDFEWVYVVSAHERNVTMIPSKDLPALWKKHINRAFWCANQYSRQLMDLGMTPPLTGSILFNPWSDFNISGQFVAESWGLISPGMPRTAARIGLNYTRVTIDGEPAQATQLFTSMIATAFLTDDLDRILEAGLAAVHEKSVIRQIVADVREWHRSYPEDWRTVRRMVRDKYSQANGGLRDRNGHELNTAATIAALLFGRSDYLRTSVMAFNFGWDADNNAAMACTIVGVIKGHRWMMSQGWNIKDVYRNTSRDELPLDETITRFGDRLIALAERNIVEQGGQMVFRDGQKQYHLNVEEPANVEPLSSPEDQQRQMARQLRPAIAKGILLGATAEEKALAAYQAICLDLAAEFQAGHPEEWTKALEALRGFPKVIQVLFYESPLPAGDRLRERALAAGLDKPASKQRVW